MEKSKILLLLNVLSVYAINSMEQKKAPEANTMTQGCPIKAALPNAAHARDCKLNTEKQNSKKLDQQFQQNRRATQANIKDDLAMHKNPITSKELE